MNEYTSVESTVGKRVMFGASRWLDEKAANGSSAATIVVAVADRWRMTIPSVDLGCGATPLVAGCTSCAMKRMHARCEERIARQLFRRAVQNFGSVPRKSEVSTQAARES